MTKFNIICLLDERLIISRNHILHEYQSENLIFDPNQLTTVKHVNEHLRYSIRMHIHHIHEYQLENSIFDLNQLTIV